MVAILPQGLHGSYEELTPPTRNTHRPHGNHRAGNVRTHAPSRTVVLTPRLEIRLPRESDRARFVELFCDEAFMVFSGGVHDVDSAHARFDEMLRRGNELPFAK